MVSVVTLGIVFSWVVAVDVSFGFIVYLVG